MRKSKEERVLEHGYAMLEELHRVYKEGIGIEEYSKLLNEYKKLTRRYDKTIKLGDNMGHEIMEKNDTLSDSLKYTIQTARSKLMDNVVEHRKTKETSSKYQSLVKELEQALRESYDENNKLKREIQSYEKHYGKMKNEFYDEVQELKTNKQSNTINSITEVLIKEIDNGEINITLLKIVLNNFKKMVDVIDQNSSKEKFLEGIGKYLKNSFHKEDIVVQHHDEQFYVICKTKSLRDIQMVLDTLNTKRKVLNFPISFTVGATKFRVDKDSVDSMIQRCDDAYHEAMQSSHHFILK